MPKFYFYTTYGLNIMSSMCFPELVSGKHNSNAMVYFIERELRLKLSDKRKGFNEIVYTPNDILYSFDNKPLFRVRYGKEILINSIANIDSLYLRHLILGPGMGTLLRQRGYLVLHASAVDIKGNGVAFLGDSGFGKSTLVTAMSKKGHKFITDDVLRVKFDESNMPLALPSFPRAKLWDDIINHIKDQPNLVQKIHPEIEKYSFNIDTSFTTKPIPLKNIYILKNNDKNEINLLKSQDALIELIKSSYAVNLFGDNGKAQNLIQCANIVNNIPIKCLKKRQRLKELNDLIRIVEKDALK